jgi:arginyl-tRNA synthetase
MQNTIAELMTAILESLGMTGVTPAVSRPEQPVHGDYTTVALVLSKQAKRSPRDLALQVTSVFADWKQRAEAGQQDLTSSKTYQKVSVSDRVIRALRDVERLEVAGPGFINAYVAEAKLSTHIKQVLDTPETVGTLPPKSSGRKVMVEFTDPNPFKEFHIGHLYSNAVGESLSRIFEAVGDDVRRADYFGDVGMHVAKSLWGLTKKLADDHLTISDLAVRPLQERINYLGAAYALGATTFEENDAAKEEMKDINYLVYIAGQQHMVEKYGHTATIDYKRYVDEAALTKLPQIAALYSAGREWSLAYFESIYARLGTKFDQYYPESVVGETGAKLVWDHVADGIFEKSDGAIVFRGEEMGLHTRVFINSLGLPTYEAKELGLAPTKYRDFPYDRSFIVTGNEINEYFRVLMAALGKINPTLAAVTTHVGHGMVRLKTGKMSSRTGQVITGMWLLDETKKQIRLVMEQSDINYKESELSEVMEKAAIAAIKYSFLKVSLPQDIAFDFKESININGDSGPYLQYTYARCRSVLRKAADTGHDVSHLADMPAVPFAADERTIGRQLLYFGEAIAEAARDLAPSTVALYLLQLCQLYNNYYGKYPILTAPEGEETVRMRLALTAATAAVITRGLALLGIPTVERM